MDSPYYLCKAEHFTSFGGRWYGKCNVGQAYVASIWTPSQWTFGFLVSQDEDAVDSNCSYASGYVSKFEGSFNMYGNTWYFNASPYAWQGIHSVSPQNRHIDFRSNSNIPAENTVAAYEQIAKEFLKIIYE